MWQGIQALRRSRWRSCWRSCAPVLLIALLCVGLAACADYGSYLPYEAMTPAGCGGLSPSATPRATATATAGAAPSLTSVPASATASASAIPCPPVTASASGTPIATPSATASATATPAPTPHAVPRFIGAFGVDTPGMAQAAAGAGVNAAFIGAARDRTSALGAALAQNGIQQIVSMPEVYLNHYECHRLTLIHVKSYPLSCSRDYPDMTEQTLLGDIQQSVVADGGNPDVVGYYILDDWPLADTAEAKRLLLEINALIHRLAPGKPTICGFGGSISPKSQPWDDYISAVFDSYSPAGCDFPALEIYAEPASSATVTASDYDWSMTSMLPHMKADLAARGWNPGGGFVGVGQAWSGSLGGSPPLYEVEPTAADMAAQAAAFCRAGAIGVADFKWDAGSSATPHTPSNDPQLAAGMARSARACAGIWNGNG